VLTKNIPENCAGFAQNARIAQIIGRPELLSRIEDRFRSNPVVLLPWRGTPGSGPSWEGFAVEEVLRIAGDREGYFWNTQGGAELDLLVFVHGQWLGFEFKYADAPIVTSSRQGAREDWRLDHVFVVHPGAKSYPLNEWAEAASLPEIRTRMRQAVGG
jgi:hypothetical protein